MPRTPVPGPLVVVAARFEAWRSRRTGRVIPAELWRRATELAGRYGVHATARALRLNYYSLRRRVAAPCVRTARTATASPTPAFVEIGPAPSASECMIEVEDAQGTKIRVQLKGVIGRDLATLAQLFVARP